jgi:hypothetical protein
MKNSDREQMLLQEFAEFVEAAPAVPDPAVDARVLQAVAAELAPPRWRILARLAAAQTAGGVLTLGVCPQFGFGFGTHQAFIHGLHAALPPVLFYLACGLFFVSLGAVFSALLLRRSDFRALGRTPWRFFVGYGILGYATLLTLGSDAFVMASLAWIAGAVAGNVLGFAAAARLRLRPV